MKYTNALPLVFILVLGACLVIPAAALPADAPGWYALGENLTAQNNYTAALEAYDHALSLDPSFADAWNGRADILNRAYQYTPDPLATLNLALAASDKALELNASSVPLWINRGQILYNVGYYYGSNNDQANATKYYNEQLEAFNKALALEPANTDALFNKGYALCGMGRCTEGLADFEKVKSLDPTYPYIDGNIESAQKVAAKETPFYVKYAFAIVLCAVAIIGAALWYLAVRKKYA